MVQCPGKFSAALRCPLTVLQAEPQGYGIIVPACGIFLQIIRRIRQIDPAAKMIKHLPQDPPPYGVCHIVGTALQQYGESVCRPVDRGTLFGLQPGKQLQLAPDRFIIGGTSLCCFAVSRLQDA